MDQQMKELIEAFVEESQGIVESASSILDELQDGDGNMESFAQIGQRIDGIMGCAKTMGLDTYPELAPALKVISNLSEGCKALGYQAAEIRDSQLAPMAAGFLADAVEILGAAVLDLKKGYVSIDMKAAERIKERLAWFTEKTKLSPEDQKRLLARFGLS
jgi:chemotaxis protein histidine kinase CheA